MATTTFSGPVRSTNGFIGDVTGNMTGAMTATAPVKYRSYTVASLPSAAANVGTQIYVSNTAGGGSMAFSNGTDWIDMVTGVAVVA